MSVGTSEGDPGKLRYFKDPNWCVTPMETLREAKLDPRGCFGCCFGTPPDSRKWPHRQDSRCQLWRDAHRNCACQKPPVDINSLLAEMCQQPHVIEGDGMLTRWPGESQ